MLDALRGRFVRRGRLAPTLLVLLALTAGLVAGIRTVRGDGQAGAVVKPPPTVPSADLVPQADSLEGPATWNSANPYTVTATYKNRGRFAKAQKNLENAFAVYIDGSQSINDLKTPMYGALFPLKSYTPKPNANGGVFTFGFDTSNASIRTVHPDGTGRIIVIVLCKNGNVEHLVPAIPCQYQRSPASPPHPAPPPQQLPTAPVPTKINPAA